MTLAGILDDMAERSTAKKLPLSSTSIVFTTLGPSNYGILLLKAFGGLFDG